jgi:hypothetical protein
MKETQEQLKQRIISCREFIRRHGIDEGCDACGVKIVERHPLGLTWVVYHYLNDMKERDVILTIEQVDNMSESEWTELLSQFVPSLL